MEPKFHYLNSLHFRIIQGKVSILWTLIQYYLENGASMHSHMMAWCMTYPIHEQAIDDLNLLVIPGLVLQGRRQMLNNSIWCLSLLHILWAFIYSYVCVWMKINNCNKSDSFWFQWRYVALTHTHLSFCRSCTYLSRPYSVHTGICKNSCIKTNFRIILLSCVCIYFSDFLFHWC